MKKHLQSFQEFINEADDPNYYQETFYFTILISMTKAMGGSRDETKNDIRALPEVLTVTLVEPEKGGVQRDIGTKYLSTLKVHVRRPKGVNKNALMKKLVLYINNLRGITVLRYKERKPQPRRKAFRGTYQIDEEGYQQNPARKRRLRKAFNRYTKTGPNTGGPFKNVTDDPDWKSAPPGAPGGLEEEHVAETVHVKIGDTRDELLAFQVQPELNQQIWENSTKVRPGVKGALMAIVDEFLERLELEATVKDVILTGSMANYNWSKFSDIDLHILMDFAEINENEELVKKFFDAVRSRWNKQHEIYVKGHEVEIYLQNEHEPHTSTGVYSLLRDDWIVKPQKIKPEIDEATAKKKMSSIAKELDKLVSIYDNRLYEDSFEMAERVKDKISKMRRGGLERSGIYSPENLAFKMLRRSGDIERLFDIYTKSYDKLYSLDQ